MSASRHDLSGPWYGRYVGAHESNSYIALLEDHGGHIVGDITEPDEGGNDALRRAVVNGVREGATVRFVKQYDGELLAHAVDYRGTLSDDGMVIAGSWSFDRYSGDFTMEREIFSIEELEDEEAVPVDTVSPGWRD